MAHNNSINYGDAYYVSMEPPPGGEQIGEGELLRLIQWVIDRLVENGDGNVRLEFLELPNNTFATLGVQVPILAPVKRNLLGLRHLLQCITQRRLVLADNIASVNAQLNTKFTDAVRVNMLFNFLYHPGHAVANMATGYDHFLEFCKLILLYVRHTEWKCADSIKLAKSYEAYLRIVEPLPDRIHELDNGAISLADLRAIHVEAKTAKQAVKDAYESYWGIPDCPIAVPAHWAQGPGWEGSVFRRIFPDFNLENILSVAAIRQGQTNRNLHNLMVHPAPITFGSWVEIIPLNDQLQKSIDQTRGFKEDPKVTLQRKGRVIKASVEHIKTRVLKLLMEPEAASMYPLTILYEDLEQATRDIANASANGLDWSEEVFGCNREVLADWRAKVAEHKDTLMYRDKQKKRHDEARADANAKAAAKVKWPKISKTEWPEFLSMWIKEADTLPNEWHKVNVLRGQMELEEDKEATKLMTDSHAILENLKSRHGGLPQLVPYELRKLDKLTRPANDNAKAIISNCHKLQYAIDFVKKAGEITRLESTIVKGIIKNTFSAEIVRDYNKELRALKISSKAAAIEEGKADENTYDNYFESAAMIQARLDFLCAFIEEQIDIQKSSIINDEVPLAPKKAGRANKAQHQGAEGGDHSVNLIDKDEKWRCSLCNTNHATVKGKTRKYYFNGVCAVFSKYSYDEKERFVKSNKLCRVCSNSKDINHPSGQDCPFADKLACSICKDKGELIKSKSHHKELHRLPRQAGAASRGRGGRGRGRDGRDRGDPGLPPGNPPLQPGGHNYSMQGYQWPQYPQYQQQGPYYGQGSSGGRQQLALPAPQQDCHQRVDAYNYLSQGTFGPHSAYQSQFPQQALKRKQAAKIEEIPKIVEKLFSEDDFMRKLFENSPSELLPFESRHYFQSVLEAVVINGHGCPVRAISLSDDGATLNFARLRFLQECGLQPIGIWVGSIKTVYQLVAVESPIYKIQLKHNRYSGQNESALVIATDDIGFREPIPENITRAIAKMFNVDPSWISNPSGHIDILLGLDNQSLLLKESTYTTPANNPTGKQEVYKSPFMKDITLSISVLSEWSYIKGAIGGLDEARENVVFYSKGEEYRSMLSNNSVQTTAIYFSKNFTQPDIDMANTWHKATGGSCYQSSSSARMPTAFSCKAVAEFAQARQPPPGGPNGGQGPGKTSSAAPPSTTPTAPAPAVPQPGTGTGKQPKENSRMAGKPSLSIKNMIGLQHFSLMTAGLMAMRFTANNLNSFVNITQLQNSSFPGLPDNLKTL